MKPAPPRDDDIAEPSPTAERDQPAAKPVTTSKPEPASEPEPEPAPEPEPVSGADPASEPELTLVPGATVAASAAASAPATSKAERPEQDKPAADAEPAGPEPAMEVTVAPGVPRHHSAHCTLIRFMGDSDLDKMTLAAAREIGPLPAAPAFRINPKSLPSNGVPHGAVLRQHRRFEARLSQTRRPSSSSACSRMSSGLSPATSASAGPNSTASTSPAICAACPVRAAASSWPGGPAGSRADQRSAIRSVTSRLLFCAPPG